MAAWLEHENAVVTNSAERKPAVPAAKTKKPMWSSRKSRPAGGGGGPAAAVGTRESSQSKSPRSPIVNQLDSKLRSLDVQSQQSLLEVPADARTAALSEAY